jgi:hypothetical protein
LNDGFVEISHVNVSNGGADQLSHDGREGEVADGRFGASSSQNLDFSDWPV